MKIIIAGGTGFIGQALVKHFLEKKSHVVVIGRTKEKIVKLFDQKITPLIWEELDSDDLHHIKTSDFIINLAGANISEKRWNEAFKNELLNSRLKTTKNLTEICALLGNNSPPLFNASAVSVYGAQHETKEGLPAPIDERETIDFNSAPTFLARIAREWEKTTFVAKDTGARVINMRFGLVLDPSGGFLAKLKMAFSMFLGGPLGTGQQPLSWIALPDLIKAIDFLIVHNKVSGPVNFVAPECVTQKEFAKILGEVLHRPAITPMPESILKMMWGKEMAEELLLQGQNVKPYVLEKNNFQFTYPTLKEALTALLK